MYTFAQSCLCIIRAWGFCEASQFNISYIYLLLKEKFREDKCTACYAFHDSIYVLLQGFFLRCFGVTMVFIDLFFFLFILLKQRWLQKMMCAVGTDVFVEVSKEWLQPTSLSLPFCFQNKEMGCSGAKFDTERFGQQNKTCWSSSHARLNTDFSCYFCTIEAFIFLCNTWDNSFFLGSLSH